MLTQLLVGVATSLINFGIHAVMTVAIVVISGRIARETMTLHLLGRVSALLAVTMLALMAAHILEITVWMEVYNLQGIAVPTANNFEFAFENYTALGYGDALPGPGQRLTGALTSLNGLLLIGWSVAVIFEVMRIAECRFERPLERKANAKTRRSR